VPGLVLTAAGSSTRFGPGPTKALLPLLDEPVLVRAAEPFRAAFPEIPIVVTVRPEDRAAVEAALAADPRLAGAVVVEGGPTRQESVRRGLAALPEGVRIAMVHDAARPCVSRDLVRRVAGAAERDGAAAPVLPLSDSVHRVDDDDRIVESLPRASLRAVQTPQAARIALLRHAFAEAARRDLEATDEVGLLLAIGVAVTAVPGDPENVKLTVPEDLVRAEEVLRRRAARSAAVAGRVAEDEVG
jgi:2-C-methyl-D-erythritol 4-phosphate cytidylyltransferase